MELACVDVSKELHKTWDSNTYGNEGLLDSLKEIQVEATIAKTILLELAPHIQGLHERLIKLKALLNTSNARQLSPEVKKLISGLKALQPYISDVTKITEDLTIVLDANGASSDESVTVTFNLPPTFLTSEDTDNHGDVTVNPCGSPSGMEECLDSSSHPQTEAVDVEESKPVESITIADEQMLWCETKVVPTLPQTPEDTKQKKCYICHARIGDRSRHMQKYHPGQKPFRCSKCPMSYCNFKELRLHNSTHKVNTLRRLKMNLSQTLSKLSHGSKRKKSKCYICHEMISHRGRHMQKCHPGEKAFQCSQCAKAFHDYQDLRRHRSTHRAISFRWDKSYLSRPLPKVSDRKNWKKCYICHERIANRSRHMEKFHTGRKGFCCSQCPMAFDDYKDFQKHKATHKVTAFKCDLCNRVYSQRAHLFSHIETHVNEKPIYMCHVCGEVFKVKKSLSSCKHGLVRKVPPETPARNLNDLEKLLTGSPLLCKLCGKSFSDVQSLQTHLDLHSIDASSNRPFKCESCGKRFAQEYLLEKHMELHKEICHTCETCNKSFLTFNQKKIHRRIHHKGELFNCFFCLKTFTEQKSLDQHLNVHTGEKPFDCEICHKKFPSSSSKKNHQYRVHSRGYLPFECAICEKRFTSKFVRETHYLREHTQDELNSHSVTLNRIKCECGKLVRKEYMKRHRASHSTEKPFVCEICGKKLPDLSRLKRHNLCHLEKGERPPEGAGPHICDICGKGYSRASYLKQHKLLHAANRMAAAFECGICGKKLMSKPSLLQHKRRHGPDQGKNHICDVCGKAFALNCSLKLHYTSHTGDQPYKCAICGRGFLTKQAWRAHDVVHTKEKPYTCELCGMSFTTPSSQQRHMIQHTGERPFQCDICGKSFKQKHVMQVHRRIHTGEKPHQCDVCSKRFADPSTLVKHKAIHSTNNSQPHPPVGNGLL